MASEGSSDAARPVRPSRWRALLPDLPDLEPFVPPGRIGRLAAWGVLVGAAETASVGFLFLVGLSLASGGAVPDGPFAGPVATWSARLGLPAIVLLALGLVAAVAARAALSLVHERRLLRLHAGLVVSAFDRLMPGYFAMDYTRFAARNSADRAQQVIQDLDRAALAVVSWVRAASMAIVLVLLGLLLVAVDWRAAALGAAAALLVGAAAVPLLRRTSRMARDRRSAHADLAVAVSEPLRAYRDLATSGLWPRFVGRARADYDRYLALSGSAAMVQAATPHVLELGVAVLVAAAVAIASGLGTPEAATPVLVLLVAGAYRFLPALQRLLHGITTYRLNQPSLDLTLRELKDVGPAPLHAPEGPHLFAPPGEPLAGALVSLERVHFGHPGAEPVLRGVSLLVDPAERIGIVGPSGVGKSTLVDLLLGLLKPTSGVVRRGLGPNGRTLRFAYLPQQPAFVAGTVLDNLALAGESTVDAGEARRLLDLVGLNGLPLQQRLGEGGQGLSVGQRQLLGLARALHREPDLLLLDEPTANLDRATEEALLNALDQLEGVALLVVTHRPAPLALCDRTLRLVDGRLVPETLERALLVAGGGSSGGGAMEPGPGAVKSWAGISEPAP